MIEGLLVDLDGVLVKDGNLNIFNDAPEFINFLYKNNIPFKIATNNSRKPPEVIGKSLRNRGLDIKDEDIISPLSIAPKILKKEKLKKLYVLGTDELKDFFRNRGFTVCEDTSMECVIIGMDKQINFQKIKIITTGLKNNNGKLFGLNKNLISKDDDGMLFPGVGSVTEMFSRATGIKAEYLGKMSDLYNRVLFESLGLPPEKLGIISDDLFIDLKGYKNLGLKTFFITTGKYKVEDIKEFKPDYIFNSLSEIIKFMEEG
ncbi:HAD-IIA family hydrolase [Persephonella sp.]